jgi:hypothetical protein
MNFKISRYITALLAACLLSTVSMAQEVYSSSGQRVQKPKPQKEKGFNANRLIFGGGLGLSFGQTTAIAVAPVVGYRITDNFAAGIGLGYQYFRVKDYLLAFNHATQRDEYFDYKSSVYSGSVWARYIIFRNLFAHAEYEHNLIRYKEYYYDPANNYNLTDRNVNIDVPALLLGGGLRQPVSDRSSFVIMALYDVLQDEFSPYYKRVDFRMGFNVGF